jgi:hypothetical protein
VSFSLSSAASFFDWSQSHCFSLLRLVFPFLTLFYGNDGTKFPEKAERRVSVCPQAAQREGGNTENRGISVTTNRQRSNDLLTSNALLSSLASQKKNALSGPESAGKRLLAGGEGKGIPGYPPFFRFLKQLIFQFEDGVSLINIPRIRLEAEMSSSFATDRQLAHFKLRKLAPAKNTCART